MIHYAAFLHMLKEINNWEELFHKASLKDETALKTY